MTKTALAIRFNDKEYIRISYEDGKFVIQYSVDTQTNVKSEVIIPSIDVTNVENVARAIQGIVDWRRERHEGK